MTNPDQPQTFFKALDLAVLQASGEAACRLICETLGAEPAYAATEAGYDIRFDAPWEGLPSEERRKALRRYAASLVSNAPAASQGVHERRVYDRDGMIDEAERRAFAEELEAEEDADLQAFVETRTRMTVAAFTELTGDDCLDLDPESFVLAYENRYWIQICADGRCQLILGNQCWITGEDTSLEDLERELFNYAET